jgi:hypothetical protein
MVDMKMFRATFPKGLMKRPEDAIQLKKFTRRMTISTYYSLRQSMDSICKQRIGVRVQSAVFSRLSC